MNRIKTEQLFGNLTFDSKRQHRHPLHHPLFYDVALYKTKGRGILISGNFSLSAGEGGAHSDELWLRADSL